MMIWEEWASPSVHLCKTRVRTSTLQRATAQIRLPGRKLAKRREQPIHFFAGVVVHQANAQDAAVLFDAQALGEIQCVEISVPSENSALAKEGSNFRGMVVVQAER